MAKMNDYNWSAVSTVTTTFSAGNDAVHVVLYRYGWFGRKWLRLKCAVAYFWANLVSGRRQRFERKRLANGWVVVSWEWKEAGSEADKSNANQ